MKPAWLKAALPSGDGWSRLRRVCAREGLDTVCASARCPNLGECWAAGTATFMLLGGRCTRACRFCSVPHAARPAPPPADEPGRLARAVAELGLRYVVLTTVCRDDLPDQGAAHIAACVAALKTARGAPRVELLMQDFRGEAAALRAVLASGPDILGHNIETVERLTPLARDPRASYRRSLGVLAALRRLAPAAPIKSSLMLGLGETDAQTLSALRDLRRAGADLLTLGQYLRPGAGPRHLTVARYVPPEEFSAWAVRARALGFKHVAAGPFVRSSYRASEAFAASVLEATSCR
ncbi:MAG: lipoyl synthase [Elusimicrobia bacterium]|nr:lipoyl synthase [Elusimicrobiota bacterium]